MEQVPAQEPSKAENYIIIEKEWRERENGKNFRLIRIGDQEMVQEETETGGEEAGPPRGWREVPLSDHTILREYEIDGVKMRDIVYKKFEKIGTGPHPEEEGVFFYNATQKLENDDWVTVKEKRMEDKRA
jgi:hypothetical protein